MTCDIKSTIAKNSKEIKVHAEHCEIENKAHLCQFCDSGRPGNFVLKIQMHKMTGFLDEYTHFRLKVLSCTRCLFPRMLLKSLAILLGIASWPVLFIIIIIIRQYKETWFSRLYWFAYSHLFGMSVKNHPMIKEYLNQGYEMGKPFG